MGILPFHRSLEIIGPVLLGPPLTRTPLREVRQGAAVVEVEVGHDHRVDTPREIRSRQSVVCVYFGTK